MVSRRGMIAGGAGAAGLAAVGYRAWDRGVFSFREGPAFAPWAEWQGRAGEGIVRPLHAAILAANPHDTQPWLFAPHGDSITVWAGEGIVRPLHAAIPAANPHDTQPWLFAPHGDSITVWAGEGIVRPLHAA